MTTTDCSFTDEDILPLKLGPQEAIKVRSVLSWRVAGPKGWRLIIETLNSIMRQHGIEYLIQDGKTIASYVNTGETYEPTVLYDHDHKRFVISSWGSFLEDWKSANLIEVSLESVARTIHNTSHDDFYWKDWTDGPVENYDSIEEWLESASIDIRLRVQEDGNWTVLIGSPDFDPDHRGAWGSSSVGKCQSMGTCVAIARDLINQAADNIHLTKTIVLIED